MSGENRADRAVETFLANLLIQICASIKTDQAFRPDINYDLQNPASIILLVEDAIRELKRSSNKPEKLVRGSKHASTRKKPVSVGAAQKPKVSFQTQTEILCRSAEQRVHLQIHKLHEGAYFIDDSELDDVRKLVLAGAL
jgi:hypothetical protein